MILILTKSEWENELEDRDASKIVNNAIWAADIVFMMDEEGICDIVKNRKNGGTRGRISVSDIGHISNEERIFKK